MLVSQNMSWLMSFPGRSAELLWVLGGRSFPWSVEAEEGHSELQSSIFWGEVEQRRRNTITKSPQPGGTVEDWVLVTANVNTLLQTPLERRQGYKFESFRRLAAQKHFEEIKADVIGVQEARSYGAVGVRMESYTCWSTAAEKGKVVSNFGFGTDARTRFRA